MTSDYERQRDPQGSDQPDHNGGKHEAPVPAGESSTVRQDVVAKEKEQFGGVKVGSAFFGWLTATGTLVLLGAAVAVVALLLGYNADAGATRFTDAGGWEPGSAAWVGAIIALVILFVSYLAGGYVAGRMARFNGARQGVAVWAWAVLASLAVTISGILIGDQSDLGQVLDAVPQTTVSMDEITAGSVIAVIITAVVALAGAVLGGILGMRFHRRVDKAGLGH
jgi:hypothetical protein